MGESAHEGGVGRFVRKHSYCYPITGSTAQSVKRLPGIPIERFGRTAVDLSSDEAIGTDVFLTASGSTYVHQDV